MKYLAGKKIFVGLSGGVDSAVTAALLQQAGADVYGVFIKGWYPPELLCTWASDRRDAMRVAAHLGIPFHTLDASKEYKRSVIDYLVREYGAGRTPNPDIMCNRDVKFGVFYEFAKAYGADHIATGHYARQEGGRLLQGLDPEKDQSYFLWAISPLALSMTLFPLGALHKSEVRTLAKSFDLPNADKRDSQGICFLGPVSMDDFLRAELPNQPGKAIDESGIEVGQHDGVLLSTLGERIALRSAVPGPWYVLEKDIPNNVLVVAKERRAEASTSALHLADANWFTKPSESEEVHGQYRYHGPFVAGVLRADVFVPNEPATEPIASGQSLVLYQGDEVLGGGIIG
ncbi:MAG: tRNA-specific 2-thiouridylase MnmA [Parcubacteria group bacterium]|nr:tRNA-specific 2-thiouridylase MnmA [Parcubacteria group bacterium]